MTQNIADLRRKWAALSSRGKSGVGCGGLLIATLFCCNVLGGAVKEGAKIQTQTAAAKPRPTITKTPTIDIAGTRGHQPTDTAVPINTKAAATDTAVPTHTKAPATLTATPKPKSTAIPTKRSVPTAASTRRPVPKIPTQPVEPTAAPQVRPLMQAPAPGGGDHVCQGALRCDTFGSHAEAQEYFERCGRPGGMDRDHDGQACETLP